MAPDKRVSLDFVRVLVFS